MRTVRDIEILQGIPVLVRAALNVPVADGNVVNAFRLSNALPTIKYLMGERAKVILCGHIGEAGTETLKPVYDELKKSLPTLAWCPVATGPEARAAARALPPGGVLMLENLRRDKGETGNDPAFAAKLAELADIFVEDSFDVCHRPHASVVGVPQLLPSYAGFLVEKEVAELSKALKPKPPSLAIIGGAKFATKEPVLKALLAAYDHVFVGGALANDFMQAKGLPMESSLVSGADPHAMAELLDNPRLLLPVDEVIAAPDGTPDSAHTGMLDGKPPMEAVRDDGPETVAMLCKYVAEAKTVLWNGPLGNYEKGFVASTEALARAIAAGSAYSIIGGGDTIGAIEKLGLDDRFSFVSTGGGAMLDFLAKGTLPGIQALG